MRPKSLTLLIYFVENPGRVIGKEELIAAVWPDVVVSDDSLSQCLKDIRGVLGERTEGFIRTVPRRGYVVDERWVHRKADPAPQPDRPSIVVMPFRPLANDREHLWFSQGASDDIATALARSRRLFVVPRYLRSSEATDMASLLQAARDLGVRYLLDGSVRLTDDRIRVSAQLVDVRSGELVWADRFDRRLVDLFSIQDEITEAIVTHLEIELVPLERDAIQLSRTDNIEAYTYYRHGWQLARHWTKAYLLVARRMFAQAAELDPEFARAHSAIALCDCYLLEWFASSETPGSILAMAERALSLDANLAEAHVARGLAFQKTGRIADAQIAYAEALVIDPTCFEARLFAGFLAWTQGQRDLAVEQFSEAAQLRRDDYLGPYFVLAAIDKANPEKCKWAQLALDLAERTAVLQPDNPALLSRGAVALNHLGRFQDAVSWIKRALILDPDDPITNYNAASVYSLIGDQETALHFLEIYVRHSAEDMVDLVSNDDDLAGIRSYPGYGELLARGWRQKP